jgi:hypothetical protein
MGGGSADFWGNFWPGFFGNLLSDFLISAVLLAFLPRILEKTRPAKLEIVASVVDFSPRVMILFYLKNVGKLDFRADEIYWHVFLEQDRFAFSDVRNNNKNPMKYYEHHMIGDRPYVNFEGQLRAPIFPDRAMALFTMMVSSKLDELVIDALKRGSLIYSLSTARGVYPRRPNLFRRAWAHLRKVTLLEDGHGTVAIVTGGSWNLKLM